jgi:hypothetical protein
MSGITIDLYRAVPADYFSQAALAEPARSNLRGQVTFPFGRRSHVGQQHFQHFAAHLALPENFDRWNAQSLLENFPRRTHGARQSAANVCVMRTAGNEEVWFRIGRQEYRHHQRQVG